MHYNTTYILLNLTKTKYLVRHFLEKKKTILNHNESLKSLSQ